MKEYDYIIVGAGLAGSLSAYKKSEEGSKCLVLEKKPHIGGFCYSKNEHGIEVHKYGAHIFRTDNKAAWDFVNGICEFIPFVNSPIANYMGRLYNLPFNMNTFYQLFGATTPGQAKMCIENDRILPPDGICRNMEDVVLSQVGKVIYEKLIKGYSEKQWGRPCSELPPETMAHVPVRFTFDNNYYDVKYQGIPVCGYTEFMERLLDYSDLQLRCNFNSNKEYWKSKANHIIYTGKLDEYFDFCFGELEYRSVRFEHQYYPNTDDWQGVAVVNYTDTSTPVTRTIEHKHFLKSQKNVRGTMVSYEYPCIAGNGNEPIYPVRDEKNLNLYAKYKELAEKERNVSFVGQLADYVSYNMSHLIEKIL